MFQKFYLVLSVKKTAITNLDIIIKYYNPNIYIAILLIIRENIFINHIRYTLLPAISIFSIIVKSTESELIKKLRNGSYKAFNSIYDLYAKRLYAYCIQYLKSPEDAEEIVHDVFIQLWQERENIRQNETLASLLFIMSKHKLINAWRAKLNHPLYEDYVNYVNQFSVDDTGNKIEYDDFMKKIHDILVDLPDTQRKVITLSRFKQLTNKEIAAILQLSEQTVKNQLVLGIKKLKEKLGKYWGVLMLLFVN